MLAVNQLIQRPKFLRIGIMKRLPQCSCLQHIATIAHFIHLALGRQTDNVTLARVFIQIALRHQASRRFSRWSTAAVVLICQHLLAEQLTAGQFAEHQIPFNLVVNSLCQVLTSHVISSSEYTLMLFIISNQT